MSATLRDCQVNQEEVFVAPGSDRQIQVRLRNAKELCATAKTKGFLCSPLNSSDVLFQIQLLFKDEDFS